MSMSLTSVAVDGEGAARYIKTTNGKNSNTPIVAVSAYSAADTNDNSLFAASLPKPVQRADLLAVMRRLGFKTSAVQGLSAKVTASRVS
jgi:serine/threonine-protein kinase RIM15